MKNMFESPEVFSAYAMVDYYHYAIEELNVKLMEQEKRSGIEVAIDKATGFDIAVRKEIAEDLVVCLNGIIESKKVIEAEYTNDEEALKKTTEYIESLK